MKTKSFLIFGVILFAVLCFSNQSFTGPRRLLLEVSTGTWCGNCPCGDSIIHNFVLPQFPQTVVLAYHGSNPDPFSNFNGNNIILLLGIFSYPSAIFDRQSGPPIYYENNNWPETCAVRYQRTPNSVINIDLTSKSYNTATRVLNAAINATALQNLTGQYKINYVITEDNIVYQQNYYSSCGIPGYHQNYIHYWVVRNMVNGATGENLNSGNWNQNQSITKTIITTLEPGWEASNCNLVIFVYKDTPPLNHSIVEQSTIQSVTNPIGVSGTLELPVTYRLDQNYPNPFNPTTNIKYSVPKDGNVSLKIYDVLGNEVSIIIDGFMKAGVYNAEFNGANFSSGVYFYKLESGNYIETLKMVLIK